MVVYAKACHCWLRGRPSLVGLVCEMIAVLSHHPWCVTTYRGKTDTPLVIKESVIPVIWPVQRVSYNQGHRLCWIDLGSGVVFSLWMARWFNSYLLSVSYQHYQPTHVILTLCPSMSCPLSVCPQQWLLKTTWIEGHQVLNDLACFWQLCA